MSKPLTQQARALYLALEEAIKHTDDPSDDLQTNLDQAFDCLDYVLTAVEEDN